MGQTLAMRTLSIPPNKKLSYAYHTDYLSMCPRFPAIFDCSFDWGCEPPILGKGGVGGRGWYRSKERC